MLKDNKISVQMVFLSHPTWWFLNFAAMDVFFSCNLVWKLC